MLFFFQGRKGGKEGGARVQFIPWEWRLFWESESEVEVDLDVRMTVLDWGLGRGDSFVLGLVHVGFCVLAWRKSVETGDWLTDGLECGLSERSMQMSFMQERALRCK